MLGCKQSYAPADLRVRQARAPMPAAPDDCSAFYEHSSNHGIWGCRSKAALGKLECEIDKTRIGHLPQASRYPETTQIQRATEVSLGRISIFMGVTVKDVGV